MLHMHPNARTTPAVRAEIAGSKEQRTGVLAQRYGVSTETIRKWRQRGGMFLKTRCGSPSAHLLSDSMSARAASQRLMKRYKKLLCC